MLMGYGSVWEKQGAAGHPHPKAKQTQWAWGTGRPMAGEETREAVGARSHRD